MSQPVELDLDSTAEGVALDLTGQAVALDTQETQPVAVFLSDQSVGLDLSTEPVALDLIDGDEVVLNLGDTAVNLSLSTATVELDLTAGQGVTLELGGEQGPPGPEGPPGPAGADGAVGPAGPQGDPGPVGPEGPEGVPGTDGADGAPGPAGPQGDPGPAGAQGPQGEPGAPGATGPEGPAGPQGDPGIQGPPGADGAPGATGPEGPVGATGPEGPAGADGAPGATGPAGPKGDTGDVGPEGPAGPTGATGPQGDPGPTGATGPTGPPGADSTVPGPEGPPGPQGDPGPQGVKGDTGSQGPAGATGATGPPGPGVAPGGTAGQVLSKISGTDYATQWVTPTPAGVSSVDGRTGAVVLSDLYVNVTGDTMTGALRIGTTAATTGSLGLPNGAAGAINFRSADNTANYTGVYLDSVGVLQVSGPGMVVNVPNIARAGTAFESMDFRLLAARYSSMAALSSGTRSLVPMALPIWADQFQHHAISTCESWNGTAWVPLAVATVQEIFSGYPNGAVLNSTTYPRFRVTFSGNPASYAGMLHLYQEYGPPKGYKVTLEDSNDGSVWNTLLAETTVADNVYHATIPTIISYGSFIRLTIEHMTTAHNYSWRQIRFFSDRPTNGGGQFLGLPFSWNYAKHVVAGSLGANYLSLGGAPASFGALRLTNNTNIAWQKADNSAVAATIIVQADNNLWLSPAVGQQGYLSVGGAAKLAWTTNSLWFNTGVNLDLSKNEAQNLVTHKLAAAPASPVEGLRYYDTVLKAERTYDGANWSTLADAVYVGTAAPPGTPRVGDLWWDTDEPPIAYPGAELAYNEITATANITATTAAAATLVIEGTTRTYDGSPVIVEFYTALLYSPAVVGTWTVVNLWDGNTDLGQFGQVGGGNANAIGAPCFSSRRIVPTVGTHNYRIKAWVASSGTGYVGAGPGAPVYVPAFIRVKRV